MKTRKSKRNIRKTKRRCYGGNKNIKIEDSDKIFQQITTRLGFLDTFKNPYMRSNFFDVLNNLCNNPQIMKMKLKDLKSLIQNFITARLGKGIILIDKEMDEIIQLLKNSKPPTEISPTEIPPVPLPVSQLEIINEHPSNRLVFERIDSEKQIFRLLESN